MRSLPRIAIAALLAAVAAVLGSRLRLDEDVARLLPDGNDRLADSMAVLGHLLDRMVVDISAAPGSELGLEELGDAADRLAERLLDSGLVREARASLDPGMVLPLVDLLRERCARLLEPDRLAALEERLRPARVRDAIATLLRRLQEPDGAARGARVARDPLDITAAALAPLSRLAAGFRDVRIARGRIVTQDARHLLLLAQPDFPPTDTGRSERLLESLARAVADIRRDPTFAGLEVRHLGAHRSTLDNARQIERDVRRVSLAGVILIALLVFLSFSRPWVALLAFLPALFGVLLAAGIVSCFRDSVSALVAGFTAVLAGLTVDYALHFLMRIERCPESPRLPWHPLLVSATTTVAALAALQASSLGAVRDLGLFSALAIAGAALFTLLALPAIARRGRRGADASAGGRRRGAPRWRPEVVLRWLRTGRSGRHALVGGLLVTPVFATGILRLRFEGDVQKLSSLSPAARGDEEAISRSWGEILRQSAAVVRAGSLQAALELNDRLAAVLDRLEAEGGIRDHASFSGLLPAIATQERRLRAWSAFWSEERAAALRAGLEEATQETPFRPDAFEPFFEWLAHPPAALTIDDLRSRGLGSLLEGRLFRLRGSWLAVTPVFTDDRSQVAALRERLGEEVPAAFLLDRQALVEELSGRVQGELWKLGALAFALVFALVLAWHGRILLVLLILLPLAASLVWALGILGWLGVPINFTNAIFVAFLFGVAVDYSIFMAASRLERFRRGRDPTAESDAAVLLCAATTGAGFGALALAAHPVLFSIGVTGLVGISSCLLVTAIFLPRLADGLLLSPGVNGAPGLRNLYAAAWVFAVGIGAMLWFFLVKRWHLKGGRRQAAALALLQAVARRIRVSLPVGRRLYVGREPGEGDGPFVIVSNHESTYDSFAVLALPIPVHIVVKGWVWRAPLVGRMIREAGFLPLGDGFDDLVERAGESYRRGISLLVFPEGTRSGRDTVSRFHRGAFTLARRLGAKVLPVAAVNSWTMARRGGWWVGDHEVRVAFLEPLDPEDFPGEDGDRRMARAARRQILDARERWRRDASESDQWLRILAGMYRYLGPVTGYYAASKIKRDPLVRALPAVCPGDGELLVVGCGLGIMTARLALACPGRPIRALDVDGRKVAVARAVLSESPQVSCSTGDVLEADLGRAEMALLVDVLHYWPPAVQRSIVERVAAAVPPGGRLLFRDGCADAGGAHRAVHWGEWLAGRIGFTRTRGAFHFRTEAGWVRLLAECGFAVEERHPELGPLSNRVFLCRRE
jgi:1-acyl-sn-glycerol-3-phosphate acyltransferase